MGKNRTVAFEWQELREDEAFRPLSTPSAQERAPYTGRVRPEYALIGGALALLLTALLAGVWGRQQAEAGLVRIENELAAAVDAEIWQAQAAQEQETQRTMNNRVNNTVNHAALRNLIAGQGRQKVLSTTIEVLRGNRAAIEVITEVSGGNEPAIVYRQLHFYQQTEEGWQPTEPAPTLWGERQHLATEFFDIAYRSRDAQVVERVAPELDALYNHMRRNMGLSPVPDARIAIAVVMGPASSRRIAPDERAVRMAVPSPAILHAPQSLSHAEILRHSILLNLVAQTLEETFYTHQIPRLSYPLLNALRLWQVWELDGPLAAWRAPLHRWALFYMTHGLVKTERELSATGLPEHLPEYAELCALYGMWEDLSAQLGFPLYCSDLNKVILASLAIATDIQPKKGIHLPPYWTVHQEYLPLNGPDARIYAQDRFELVLRTVLLDYIAATYGREQMAALWPALRAHTDWDTLIPAVFGVSQAEFEAGWQAYLDQRQNQLH